MTWSCKLSYDIVLIIIKLELLFTTASVAVNYSHTDFDSTEVSRPRGVPLNKKAFYEPSSDFRCMDGIELIPYIFINDDYCDCTDGSDEPGTSACIFGKFHCVNTGYISVDIPSSRVNDKVCDCCDGSDEYNSDTFCVNKCFELGRRAEEEAQKMEEIFNKGYSKWQEYAMQGKKIKEENKVKLQKLKIEEEEAEKIKNEKEALKLDAEAKEKAALSKYEILKEDQKREAEEFEMQKHEEEEKIKAEHAFKELDINQDGMLTYDEIQQFKKFDSNNDGTVSENEGKFFLHMKDSMKFEEFVTTGWMIMKPLYEAAYEEALPDSKDASSESYSNQPEHDVLHENFEELDDDLSEDTFTDDEVESQSSLPSTPSSDSENLQVPEIKYDDETQELINTATVARQEYKEALDKLENIRNEISQTQVQLDSDFGLEEQFAALKGQCFDHDDREYTYRLCPFDRASQIPKSGGSETNLGKWGTWIGPESNRYIKMKYENGLACWNGPSRSTTVILHCGLDNQILSASEPNRCEYLFEFNTPALCSPPTTNEVTMHEHTEL